MLRCTVLALINNRLEGETMQAFGLVKILLPSTLEEGSEFSNEHPRYYRSCEIWKSIEK